MKSLFWFCAGVFLIALAQVADGCASGLCAAANGEWTPARGWRLAGHCDAAPQKVLIVMPPLNVPPSEEPKPEPAVRPEGLAL